MQNRLMACWDGGRSPMEQIAASHTTRRGTVGFTPPDTAMYTPASRTSSLCFSPFSGRISGFFFALRGLHRRGRGFTHDRLQGPPFKKMRCRTAAPVLILLTPKDLCPSQPTPSEPCFPAPSHPARFPRSSMAAQNRSHGFHVVSNRSPSRIRSVRLISLGMTTRPSSSILRTIPVARNVPILLDGGATLMPHCFAVCLCIPSMEFGGVIMRRKDLGHVSPDGILEKNSARPKPGMAPEKRFH